jgi:excinuclease ABC subunit C
MKGLFTGPVFRGFGPCGLGLDAEPLHILQGRRPSQLRAQVRRDSPRRPGVYGMIDARGELIYVGKAKCLRTRLLSYFRPKSRDPKAGRIIVDARRLVWEPAASEFGALLRELELIRRWQPRCNVQGQPRRLRRGYVCVGRRPAPYVYLTAKPAATALACFGPVPLGATAREAARRLNDLFQLRDCPQAQKMSFADQGDLFPEPRAAGCLRHEIGACLGPCAALCSRAAYEEQVSAVLRFLEGDDAGPLASLQRAMAEASAALAFERAAALRDRWQALQWLTRCLERLRQAVRRSVVYPIAASEKTEIWYLIQEGRVRAATPAPRGEVGRQQAHAALTAVYRRGATPPGPLTLEEIDGVLLVDGWFRRRPVERERTLEVRRAWELCKGDVRAVP